MTNRFGIKPPVYLSSSGEFLRAQQAGTFPESRVFGNFSRPLQTAPLPNRHISGQASPRIGIILPTATYSSTQALFQDLASFRGEKMKVPLSLTQCALSVALLSGLVAAPVARAADALPPAKPLKVPELKYERFVMPNGLVVLMHEDHRLPLVAVDLWYHVGPLNERAGRTGFAHLFEHMMFEGSEHVGEKAHIKYVEGAGATDVNGTTNFDRTNYFETVPSIQLELALWLESDRMGFLL